MSLPDPYWELNGSKLYQGHVLDVLPQLLAGFAQCIVTSPPYWGLRSYPCPPLEWPTVRYAPMSGLAEIEVLGCDPECEHVWGESVLGSSRGGSGTPTNKNNRGEGYGRDAEKGQYCQRCSGWRGSYGLEPTVEMYVAHTVAICRELRRVLRDDGTLWWNLGDSYASSGQAATLGTASTLNGGTGLGPNDKVATMLSGRAATPSGLKPKDLIGIPWRVALALQADGWYLRSDIIWAKGVSFCPTYSGSCMPESVRDRPTQSYEHVFLLAKSARYFYDAMAVREAAEYGRRDWSGATPHQMYDAATQNERLSCTVKGSDPSAGRNLRSVWTINPGGYQSVVSYGSYRIASPDCPVHDYQAFLARAQQCDGLQDAFQTDHSPDTDDCLAPGQEGAVVSIPVNLSWFPLDEFVAISRNIPNYKKANELGQDVIFCGTPDDHTGYKRLFSHCAAKFDHTRGSSTEADASSDEPGSGPLERTFYHIVCTETYDDPPVGCTCYYTGKPKRSQDHFAVFPPALVEPMIKAGTSAKGCCPKCQAPYERVTTKEFVPQQDVSLEKGIRGNGNQKSLDETDNRDGFPRGTTAVTTTGWRPTCLCCEPMPNGIDTIPFEPIPCTVLDPFAGTFTTGEVAIRLGRCAVGIELSKEYCDDHIIPRLEAPLQMELL